MKTAKRFLLSALVGLAAAACTASVDVQSQSVKSLPGSCNANGSDDRACDPADTKKTTVCHIPPGNPANAHTICIGNAGVAAHLANHGDFLGTCSCSGGSGSGGGGGGTGGGSGSGSGDGGGGGLY